MVELVGDKNIDVKYEKDKKTHAAYNLTYVGCFEDDDDDDKRLMHDLTSPPTECKSGDKNVKNCYVMDKKYTDLEKQNKCAEICIKSDAEYMGIQYGYQCFCSKKKPKDDKESEKSIEMCGMGGNKCFKSGQCSLHNAVFRINNKYEHKKTPLSDRCKNYFLFDKIIDNDDDDKDKVGKDAKLNVGKKTLYDMCPKQCGVTTDECPN